MRFIESLLDVLIGCVMFVKIIEDKIVYKKIIFRLVIVFFKFILRGLNFNV